MVTMYGIPNCDTVKKARAWMAEHHVDHVFHDFKKAGVPAALDAWMRQLGWETLLNRKGTAWRQLDPAVQAGVHDAASASAVAGIHPSTIKRPVVVWDDGVTTVGFQPEAWASRLRPASGQPHPSTGPEPRRSP